MIALWRQAAVRADQSVEPCPNDDFYRLQTFSEIEAMTGVRGEAALHNSVKETNKSLTRLVLTGPLCEICQS